MARAVPFSDLPDDTILEAVDFISENLRPDDLAEITASSAAHPGSILRSAALASSLAWIIVDDSGLPLGAFGVAPGFTAGVGIPWLLGTSGLEAIPFQLARQTRRYVAEMQAAYPTLTNHVDARNSLALAWLRWAGFEFIDVDPSHGVEGRPFLQFARTRPSVTP